MCIWGPHLSKSSRRANISSLSLSVSSWVIFPGRVLLTGSFPGARGGKGGRVRPEV